jgi:hypothetical protein
VYQAHFSNICHFIRKKARLKLSWRAFYIKNQAGNGLSLPLLLARTLALLLCLCPLLHTRLHALLPGGLPLLHMRLLHLAALLHALLVLRLPLLLHALLVSCLPLLLRLLALLLPGLLLPCLHTVVCIRFTCPVCNCIRTRSARNFPGAGPARNFIRTRSACNFPGVCPVCNFICPCPVCNFTGMCPVCNFPGACPVCDFAGACPVRNVISPCPVCNFAGSGPVCHHVSTGQVCCPPTFGESLSANPIHRYGCRPAMIYPRELSPVAVGKLPMLPLLGSRLKVALPHSSQFLCPGPCVYSARTIVTVVVIASVTHHRAVDIRIMYKPSVNIKHGCVIPETAAVPSSSVETMSPVSITVINTAIETYSWPPETCMEPIKAAGKTPVRRCP